MKIFTKTVWLLSLVSLLTDISSEMLYPVMPMFLTGIGFSVVWIGILEGIAEAVAGFSKGYFGKLSDITGKRAIFVRLGYFLSSVSKPMMALILHPVWILFARTTDRLGKGIRTASRDAILSAETTPGHKGKVFGLHRAADTLGAAIGPFAALIFLQYYPGNYIHLFYIAFIPAIVGVGFTFFIKDKTASKKEISRTGFFSFLQYWKTAPVQYRRLVAGLLVFSLINSSDMFLLLMIKNKGMADIDVLSIYIFYNLVYALFSTPLGYLGDKFGLKKVLIIGLILFSAVYFGVAIFDTKLLFFVLFYIYGLYAAATEGISKAWITNIVKKEDTATAIGFYTGWQSITTLGASISAGVIWVTAGAAIPFIISASVAGLTAVYLAIFSRERVESYQN